MILHYKDPVEGNKPETELDEKTAIVQLGDMVAHAAGIGSPEGYPSQMENILPLAKFLGFDQKDLEATLEELINSVQQQFEKERHVYE